MNNCLGQAQGYVLESSPGQIILNTDKLQTHTVNILIMESTVSVSSIKI